MLLFPTSLVFSAAATSFFLNLHPGANAGSVNKGGACNITDNRLQVGTYQFYSDCDSVTYCNPSTQICTLKGCRIDDYPFGYAQDDPSIPPKCPTGQFCPDEEDACQDQMSAGSACQLDRDDQCAPPPNWQELADTSGRGLNYNGSICLNNVCTYANVTEGSSCTVENLAYIAYGANNQEYVNIVSRGNCKVGLYCDSQALICKATKDIGVSCDADKECSSYNCLASNICGFPADSAHYLGSWVYVIVAIGILLGACGTLGTLFVFHRRHRDAEREKRVKYWREQNAFRQNIMQMRNAARHSLMSHANGSHRDTIYSQESQAPMMSSANKSSGLRNFTNEDDASYYDNSADMDESTMMHASEEYPSRPYPNRF